MGILNGKTAVVTGSTSGIGLACARAFASAGANVVINGMGAPDDIERERAAIEREFAVKAIYSPADMTKPREIAWLIAHTEDAFGSVDILVNNAGIQHVAPIEEFPAEKWDAIIAINLHPRGRARHEEARLGPHHHHRFGAFAGRLAVQIGLRRGKARHHRPDQDGGAGARPLQDHLQLHQPRLCLDAARREADSEHDGGPPHATR
ncbi:SDR family NAD(P)-dependent oxidoreductase [Bradyrhizobium sp. CB1650]|uniref:SDR family NAD(P)-dependent oxidoreductase n=1 Tax=Bradyrhizobium sp. CB1650 TaxID=3039153 RepID=UPI00325FBCD0